MDRRLPLLPLFFFSLLLELLPETRNPEAKTSEHMIQKHNYQHPSLGSLISMLRKGPRTLFQLLSPVSLEENPIPQTTDWSAKLR